MTARVCPTAKAGQICNDLNCPFSHVVLRCEPCSFIFDTQDELNAHLKTPEHRRNAAGDAGAIYRCTICDIYMAGTSWKSHARGARHQGRAKARHLNPATEPEIAEAVPGHIFCITCKRHILDRSWSNHIKGDPHMERLKFAQYQNTLEEAESDKNGVSIFGDFDFGVVESSAGVIEGTVDGTIQTDVPKASIKLLDFSLSSSKGQQVFSPFSVSVKGPNRSITARRAMSFTITARQQHLGRSVDRVDFVFEDTGLKKRFIISRSLCITVDNKADYELLKPKAPYTPRKRRHRQPETTVVPGVRPPALTAITYKTKLPKALIPPGLLNTLSNGTMGEAMRKIKQVYLPTTFNSNTYARYFKSLLWIEEFQMEQDLELYDIDNAVMRPQKKFFFLGVPGLAEKRPSVLVGDSIVAQPQNARGGQSFEGCVHVVHRDEVGLQFHDSFPGAEQTYGVRFRLNRHEMRRQHLGMDTVFTQNRVLFPTMEHLPGRQFAFYPSNTVKLQLYNPLIGKNPAQKQAVVSIMKQAAGSLPFLVFGPPGTGKTMTIVEAILQLLRKDPAARILACAPSNSAADLIASRLKSLPPTELFRAYAPSRAKDQVPGELKPYTHQNADGDFSIHPLDAMKAFRVVVSTCISAAVISGIGVPRGHYSHIFIDETGQATEPEVMIAIRTMADQKTNVVLSGDPKQLGPIIRSKIARELGLEKSFIERLMERHIYDEREGHGATVVKLTKNYRSHSDILCFPNEQFYSGDLECCGDSKTINMYLRSSHIVNPTFPIVFYTVTGKDDREASSPSFFNSSEATQVKTIIKALCSDRKIRISKNDIGVISPYHAQCLKIRALLRPIADGVKVGSVEEFQGQERKVIIISTVRSSMEFVEYDLKHTLGFVASPRRFNVAVTRAKALLIIVGNPSVLSLDPLWRSFLNYIYGSGGWKGPAPSWDTTESVDEAGGYDVKLREAAQLDMNEFTRAMESLTLAGLEDDAAVDRPWNDNE